MLRLGFRYQNKSIFNQFLNLNHPFNLKFHSKSTPLYFKKSIFNRQSIQNHKEIVEKPIEVIDKKPETPVTKQKTLYQQLTPLLQFSRPEYGTVGLGLILLCVSSTVTMTVPMSMGAIIDIVTQNLSESQSGGLEMINTNGMLKDLLEMTGSLTVGAAANAGRIILMTKASESVITRLRNALFAKVLKQDMHFHDTNRSGELISRLSTDTVVIGRTLTSNIADGLRSLVMSSAGLAAMLYVNVNLTVTMMMIVPLISTVAVIYGRFIRKLAQQVTDASADLSKFAEEKLSNVRTVRAFAQDKNEIENYNNLAQRVYNFGMKEGYAASVFYSSLGLSGNLVILAILYYGGSLVQMGEISIGELSSFFLYTAYVGSSIVGLSSFYTSLNKGAGAGERIFQLLQTNSKIESTRKHIPVHGNVQFENVEFAYPTRADSLIFRDLSFSLSPGETVAIVGHSGSGKSTIAQLLLRFYDPLNGRITIDGVSIKELDPNWMRDKVMGLVSQEPVLFATTIKENIRYGKPDATDEEIYQAAKEANAHDFILQFPKGYETYVGDRGLAISGGQKQRIAIARALLKNPQILVLDEATSALDATSESLVQQALDRLIEGRTVITIAHRLSTIQKADRIFMIAKGRVCESGTFDELVQKNGHFANLIGEQE
ncbi:ATP-binding cassette sub- B member 10, mitochondrial [Globomyces sp. JEL0801]|nr:ATP-binding cassette sub- B member 10, mitochondrial [Globomyces sp. JEL0801]